VFVVMNFTQKEYSCYVLRRLEILASWCCGQQSTTKRQSDRRDATANPVQKNANVVHFD